MIKNVQKNEKMKDCITDYTYYIDAENADRF